MRNELYLYATYYQSMGKNLSPVGKSNYKKPVIDNWKRYISVKQDEIHNGNLRKSVII
jgi:hypothetical protein